MPLGSRMEKVEKNPTACSVLPILNKYCLLRNRTGWSGFASGWSQVSQTKKASNFATKRMLEASLIGCPVKQFNHLTGVFDMVDSSIFNDEVEAIARFRGLTPERRQKYSALEQRAGPTMAGLAASRIIPTLQSQTW